MRVRNENQMPMAMARCNKPLINKLQIIHGWLTNTKLKLNNAATQLIMDAKTIAKRFLAGTASGICLVAVGHPWDTLKVKMQVEQQNFTLFHTIRKTIKDNGIRGLYFGVSVPLLTTGLINTVLWGLQFNFVDFLETSFSKDKLTNTMQAAVISGIIITTLVTPMELIKSKLQVGSGRLTPMEMIQKVWKQNGVLGLYRGASAVALVRSSNWAYFGTYSFVSQKLEQRGFKNKSVNAISAGGLAGISFWLVAFGFDSCKARMMVEDQGLVSTVKSIYANHGWRGFYRGLSPCLIRAFPANAAAFFGFELSMSYLSNL